MIPYSDVKQYVEALGQYAEALQEWFDHLPEDQEVDPTPEGSNPPSKPPPPPGL